MLCGEAGTKVKVSFQRDGVAGEQEAVIQRKEVKLRDVPLRHVCVCVCVCVCARACKEEKLRDVPLRRF